VKSQGGHIRPWYYYFTNFYALTLPWFIVLLGGIPRLGKELTKEDNKSFLVFVLWICTVFIFFSCISGKRTRYLLPSFPAFSLITAYIVARWDELDKRSVWIGITGILTLIMGIVFLLFPLSVPLVKEKYPLLEIFPVSAGDWRLWAAYGMGVLAIFIAWKAILLFRRKENVGACHLIAIAFLVLFGMAQVYYVPYIEPAKSVRGATEEIKAMPPAGGTIAFYPSRYDNGWNFYLNRDKIPVITKEELKQNQPLFDVIILREKHLKEFQALIPQYNYQIISVESVGSKEFVLLRSDSMVIEGQADLLKDMCGSGLRKAAGESVGMHLVHRRS